MNAFHLNRSATAPRESLVHRQFGPAIPPASPQRPGRRPWHWIGAIAVIAAAGAFFLLRPVDLGTARPEPLVPTVQVQTGTLERTLRLTGSTVGENSVTLLAPSLRGSRTRGGGGDRFHLVLKELVSNGAGVAAGDVVATFDRVSMLERIDDLKADRDQVAGNLAVLAAKLAADREARDQQLRVARAAADKAALDLQTAPVRTPIQAAIFKLTLEESRLRYSALIAEEKDFEDSQAAQLRVAQLNLDSADLEVRQAETNAERMVVRAARPGIAVVRSIVRNGENGTIRAGDELHAGQPYLDIVAPGPMLVEAAVNQTDVRQLRIGAPAEVIPEAAPDLRLKASIISIGTIADSKGFRGSFVREVPVRLRIIGSDPRVLPSLTVSADVLLDRMENVLLVSRAAVFSQSPDGSPFALLRSGDGWERRSLQVGLTNHTAVAVLSGLTHGDIVAAETPEGFSN